MGNPSLLATYLPGAHWAFAGWGWCRGRVCCLALLLRAAAACLLLIVLFASSALEWKEFYLRYVPTGNTIPSLPSHAWIRVWFEVWAQIQSSCSKKPTWKPPTQSNPPLDGCTYCWLSYLPLVYTLADWKKTLLSMKLVHKRCRKRNITQATMIIRYHH